MTFILTFASDCDVREEITLSTMDDLKSIYEEYGDSLVVDFKKMVITIYDYWLE